MEPMLLLSIILFVIMVRLTLEIVRGSHRLGSLDDSIPSMAKDGPLVSIIVPETEREKGVKSALGF